MKYNQGNDLISALRGGGGSPSNADLAAKYMLG
jgi:hypothetical protein